MQASEFCLELRLHRSSTSRRIPSSCLGAAGVVQVEVGVVAQVDAAERHVHGLTVVRDLLVHFYAAGEAVDQLGRAAELEVVGLH